MQCYASVHVLPYGPPYAKYGRDVLLPTLHGCHVCGNAGRDALPHETYCPVACYESKPENEYSPKFKKKSLFESLCRKKESGGTILVEQITLGAIPDDREGNTAEDLRMQETYEDLFLNRNETVHRKQTYISCETYSLLARILPMVKEGMTVPAFLDNVLAHHLKTYGAELEELFHRKLGDVKF